MEGPLSCGFYSKENGQKGWVEVLRFEDITVQYGDRLVLNQVQGELAAGQVGALVGRNGVGKSTLIRCLAGLQTSSGQVWLDGKALHELSPKRRAKMLSVLLTQQVGYAAHTGRALVELGRYPHLGWAQKLSHEDCAKIERLIQVLEMDNHLLNSLIGGLSDGQVQLLQIARVLAQDAPLILLDEPFLYLDYHVKQVVIRAIQQEVAAGKTVLLSTHDLDTIQALNAECWLLEAGRIQQVAYRDLINQLSLR